ncbi:MAG: methyl-accepting chemotaxis protein, partial [bacterium]
MQKRRYGLIKNISIQARLLVAAAASLVGVIATCGAGFVGLEHSNEGLGASITATSAVLNQMNGDMMHDALRADVLFAIMTGPDGNPDTRAEIAADVADHSANFLTDLQTLGNLDLPSQIRKDVDRIKPLITDYVAAAQQVATSALADQAAGQTAFPAFMGKFSVLEVQMGVLGEEIEKAGTTVGQSAQVANRSLIKIVVASGCAAAFFLLLSNLWIVPSITKPLNRVKDAIREVATGNLGGRHSAFERVSDLKDEVSEIAIYLEALRVRLREAVEMEATIKRAREEQDKVVNALSVGLENLSTGNLTKTITGPFDADYESLRLNFNQTVDRLNQTITQVVQSSRSIRARANDISTASEDLAGRTENQAATLEETAAALDELT